MAEDKRRDPLRRTRGGYQGGEPKGPVPPPPKTPSGSSVPAAVRARAK